MDTKITAIVPSAGLGKRFDPKQRKTFVQIQGVPLLIYTLKRLQDEDLITEISPALRKEDMDRGFDMIQEHGLSKVKRIAEGGQERQDSIYNALRLIEEEGLDSWKNHHVLVHDGVRPYYPLGLIEKLQKEIDHADGVIPGIPAKDTIKEIDPEGIVVSTLDREKIRAVQTPQFFSFKIIKKAYDKALEDGFYGTDDASLVERMGDKVKIIPGSPFNIKITTPEDLEMVKYMLEKERRS